MRRLASILILLPLLGTITLQAQSARQYHKAGDEFSKKLNNMIHPHKIGKAIQNFIKWLVITNYGRFVLGMILCIFGVFS